MQSEKLALTEAKEQSAIRVKAAPIGARIDLGKTAAEAKKSKETEKKNTLAAFKQQFDMLQTRIKSENIGTPQYDALSKQIDEVLTKISNLTGVPKQPLKEPEPQADNAQQPNTLDWSPKDMAAYEWVLKNPNHPSAAGIKESLGIK